MGFVAGSQVAWSRWWGPELTENTLFNGLLPDPRDDFTRYVNRHLKPLREFASCRALVLLGEPGTGKSSELDREIARRRAAGEHVESIVLREFLTPGEVADAVRGAARSWQEAGASGDLTLAFDGFDEPLFAIQNLAPVLERELARLEPDRLRVLITSRRSAWQDRLGTAFGRWWPDAGTASLVLAPLSKRDIRQAAATELGDPDSFIATLERAGVQMLAASPMTLRLLLAAHTGEGMSSQRSKIYALGVSGLAAGPDTDRGGPGPADTPRPLRLAAARRLAAVSLLSGRSRMVRQSDLVPGEGVLGLDEVADADVPLSALQAVFDTALLADGGEGRVWTHRSVQEFLTAQQCEPLPLASVRSLLADPAHPEQVLPQLAGVAAWLAALRPDVIDWLAAAEPELLMQADLRSFSESQRARVAEAVVAKVASAPVPGIRSLYAGLMHEGLGSQLSPLLSRDEPAWRHMEATLIIQATGLRDLDGQLMDLVEGIASLHGRDDYGDDVRTAEWAARALRGTKDPHILERAARLAADADRPWPVRADLLPVLWPRHVDMAWLLKTVSEADRAPQGAMGGRFMTMLARQSQTGGCSVEDLAAWAAPLTAGAHTHPAARRLLSLTAWKGVQSSEIGSSEWRAAAGLLGAQWAANRTLTGVTEDEILLFEPERRRQLVRELIGRAAHAYPSAARMRDVGMLRVEDLQWWLDDLRRADATEAHRAPGVFALHELADAVNDEDARRVTAAAQASDPPWPDLAAWFDPAARKERAHQRSAPGQAGSEAWDADGALREPRFALLMRALHHRPETSGGPRPVPAWPALSDEQQRAVVDRSVSFLCSDPDAADEVEAELIGHACRIIETVDHTLLDRVPAACWLRWLPGLWEVPGDYLVVPVALKRAAAKDEGATAAFLIERMRQDAVTVAFHQQQLKLEPLSAQALSSLSDEAYDARALAGLLTIASATLPEETAQIALGLLQRHSSPPTKDTGPEQEQRMAEIAGACLAACPMSASVFDGLLKVLAGDSELARGIIRQAYQNANHAWGALTPAQRGRLYLWAHQALPRRVVAAGRIVRSDPVDEFSSRILAPVLAEPSAGNAALLKDLAEKTGNVWLSAEAAEMRDGLRAQAWRPPTPAEVLDVFSTPSHRIIASQEQLSAVLAETLDDIADELRTDRALRALLWHRQRHANKWVSYVPKEETEVSTWLARELERRLSQRAAVLREVEINPHLADTKGDIPDLLVQTTGEHALSVPGEVKCSWHREVITAIRDQLGHRYLQGPNGTAGVYVAVYFGGSAWDTGDIRRAQSARRTREQLGKELHTHAAELAERGITAHVCLLDASLEADEPDEQS